MNALAYLRQELSFTIKDWGTLTDKDKDDLKRWAVEEMAERGIALK